MRNIIRQFVRQEVIEEITRRSASKKLRIFDFDDTLVKTKSKVHVTSASGDKFDLTPGEYAVFTPAPGDEIDFSDFSKVIDPEEIQWTGKVLRSVVNSGGEAVILTARAHTAPIEEFLADAGIPGIQVIAVASSDPQKKADYIADRIDHDGIDYVEFFDDSLKNIEAVKALEAEYPEVRIVTRHIVSH